MMPYLIIIKTCLSFILLHSGYNNGRCDATVFGSTQKAMALTTMNEIQMEENKMRNYFLTTYNGYKVLMARKFAKSEIGAKLAKELIDKRAKSLAKPPNELRNSLKPFPELDLLYDDLEREFLKHFPKDAKVSTNTPAAAAAFSLTSYPLFAAYDQLYMLTGKVREILVELLEHMPAGNMPAKVETDGIWYRKRFAVWTLIEGMLKPLLEFIWESIPNKNPEIIGHNFHFVESKIASFFDIPPDWKQFESQILSQSPVNVAAQRESKVRMNAFKVLCVYAQMNAGAEMFAFNGKDDWAKRTRLAKIFADGTAHSDDHVFMGNSGNVGAKSTDAVDYSFMLNHNGPWLLPLKFGELIYDEFVALPPVVPMVKQKKRIFPFF